MVGIGEQKNNPIWFYNWIARDKQAKSGDDPIDAIGGFISDPNARLLRICHPCVIIG